MEMELFRTILRRLDEIEKKLGMGEFKAPEVGSEAEEAPKFDFAIVDIVKSLPRASWVPKCDMTKKVGIVIHHSYTHSSKGGSKPEAYARYHVKSKGWPCIGYHMVCQPLEMKVYRTAGLDWKSYHAGRANSSHYGVCLSGNYDSETVSDDLYDLVAAACMDIIVRHEAMTGQAWEPEIVPHSKFSSKSCPGNNFNMEKLRERL